MDAVDGSASGPEMGVCAGIAGARTRDGAARAAGRPESAEGAGEAPPGRPGPRWAAGGAASSEPVPEWMPFNGGPAWRRPVVASLVLLVLLQMTVWTVGAGVGLAVLVTASPFADRSTTEADDGEASHGSGDTARRATPRAPGDDSVDDGARDDIWRLDGFGDFADARLRITGVPGEGWSESRLADRAVWVDARCRLTADVVELDARDLAAESGGSTVGGPTDAEASEALARSLGDVALGGVETRSDPEPDTVRLPIAGGAGSVELASVALVPAEGMPDGPEFLVVSVRASVEHARAVVFALACVDTPAERADALARDLVAHFRLDTSA